MQQRTDQAELPGLDTYLKAIARRPWLVLASVVGAVLLGLLFMAVRDESFTASNRVLVGPTPYGRTRENELVVPSLEREREVLTSIEVAQRVKDQLGAPEEPVTLLSGLDVTFTPETDTLAVAYTAPSAERAAALANGFAEAYVSLRADQAASYYQSQITAIDTRLTEMDGVLVGLNAEIGALEAAAAPDAAVQDLYDERGSLQFERRTLVESRAALVAEQSVPTPAASRLSTATEPGTPDGMAASLVLALALMSGLGLGLTATFIADRLDTRVDDRFALERALGTPTLASLPSMGMRIRLSGHSLVMTSTGGSAAIHLAREGFRRLRSSLLFIQTRQEIKQFLFTSALPGEGKSTVAANTAVAIANSGRSVVLVSGDLRRPRIETLFGLEPTTGLSEILAGDEQVSLQPTSVPNLMVLPAGGFAGHTEALASERMKELLVLLQEQFDVVIIDTPPVLATADVGTMAGFGGAVVIVVDAKNTALDELAVVRTELDRVGAIVAGSVLNRDPAQTPGLFGLNRKKGYYAATRPAPASA